MTEDELADALDGLSAYDGGSLDSGIHDEGLRVRVRNHLKRLPDRERHALLARIWRDLYLTDEQIKEGYGLSEAANFFHWLEDQDMYH